MEIPTHGGLSRAIGSAIELTAPSPWSWFVLESLFAVEQGRRVTKAQRVPGSTRFIGASEKNNGITDMCDLDPIFDTHCLTVPYNGNSVGVLFYQDQPFFASDHVQVLIPKSQVTRWTLLFVALICFQRTRFSYGYKWNMARMRTEIRMPPSGAVEPDWAYMDAVMHRLIKAWSNATSTLFTAGAGPCVGGHLSVGPNAQFPDRYCTISLEFLADPILKSGRREALTGLFVTLADELAAFYASAEITSGHIWTGRSLWADGATERRIMPVRYSEGWTGLPPGPTWWSWLGGPFADYYPSLPAERTTMTANGAHCAAGEDPLDVDALVPLSQWFPSELFSTPAPNPDGQHPVPLLRATTIPAGLPTG